jgi:1,4-dihydroxy-2-naphthoate octaprenyltransferase
VLSTLATLVIHLRLHFQLLLAPVFLWGWLVAGGGFSRDVVLGFVSFHGFLYSGATAFNSYYDRDAGPVGGLERPPAVVPALLPFSLAVQAVGCVLAALVNLPFVVLYAVFVVLSFAYSHPRIRLKARTVTSLVVVGVGQGALAFLAAWAATSGELFSVLSLNGLLGAVASVLLIVALYPLTQLYQMEEDASRGDRTAAVVWGPRRCFGFALACTALGGLAMVALLARRFGLGDTLLVGVGLIAQIVILAWLGRYFDPREVLRNYRRVMRVNSLSAGALGAYLVVRLALNSP